MEKLIFTNSVGEIIELTNSAPFLIQRIEGLGSPTARIITSRGVGQDGETYHESLLDARDIRIEAAILARENIELFELRRKLNRIFNPKLREGTLTYINDFGEWNIKATSVQAPVEGEKFSSSQTFLINLRAHNPLWLDKTTISKEIATWIGGMTFPLRLPTRFATKSEPRMNIVNHGDIDTPMDITIVGPATNPCITNRLTGEFIRVNRTLLNSDKLYIDTTYGNKRVIVKDNEGNETNVFHWIDGNSTMFSLGIGDNVIEYTSDDELNKARIFIKYRYRYIGV